MKGSSVDFMAGLKEQEDDHRGLEAGTRSTYYAHAIISDKTGCQVTLKGGLT